MPWWHTNSQQNQENCKWLKLNNSVVDTAKHKITQIFSTNVCLNICCVQYHYIEAQSFNIVNVCHNGLKHNLAWTHLFY